MVGIKNSKTCCESLGDLFNLISEQRVGGKLLVGKGQTKGQRKQRAQKSNKHVMCSTIKMVS